MTTPRDPQHDVPRRIVDEISDRVFNRTAEPPAAIVKTPPCRAYEADAPDVDLSFIDDYDWGLSADQVRSITNAYDVPRVVTGLAPSDSDMLLDELKRDRMWFVPEEPKVSIFFDLVAGPYLTVLEETIEFLTHLGATPLCEREIPARGQE